MKKRKTGRTKKNRLIPIKIAGILFYINAALWLGIALLTFGDMTLSGNTLAVRVMVAGFLLFNAMLMVVCGRALDHKTKWMWFAMVAVVLFNAATAFFVPYNNLGVIALVLDVALFFALISIRKAYF
jgi:hypothetical protein